MAQGHLMTIGRTFGVVLQHDEDLVGGLVKFCQENDVRQGFLPVLLGGLSEVDLCGTCEPVADPQAPVWSPVRLTSVEAHGTGSIAVDAGTGQLSVHVHLSAGRRHAGADGYTSHLLGGTVQFLFEAMLVEVVGPPMLRLRDPGRYEIPYLAFGAS